MEIFVACNDQAMVARIRASLHDQGADCPVSRVLSLESARTVIEAHRSDALLVMFFGSQRFSPDELTVLRELCAIGGERLRVVAVGSNFDPSTILQAVRSGAVDCLDVGNNFDTELASVLDRIKVSRTDHSIGRLFAVIGAVGGVGASMLAANLAVALAQKEEKCCLLDLKLRGGDLATLLKSTPRHNLLSLASKAENLDRAMFDQSLIKHESGVHLLASPEPFSDYRRISLELIRKVVQISRSAYPNVVVDLEDCQHPEQVRTLAEADRVVIVLRPDFVSLYHTRRLLDYLTRAHVARDHILVVANQIGRPKELPLSSLEEILETQVKHCVPDEPDIVNPSLNLGMPLVASNPHSKVAMSIVRLADDLMGVKPKTADASVWKFFPIRSAASLLGAMS